MHNFLPQIKHTIWSAQFLRYSIFPFRKTMHRTNHVYKTWLRNHTQISLMTPLSFYHPFHLNASKDTKEQKKLSTFLYAQQSFRNERWTIFELHRIWALLPHSYNQNILRQLSYLTNQHESNEKKNQTIIVEIMFSQQKCLHFILVHGSSNSILNKKLSSHTQTNNKRPMHILKLPLGSKCC